MTTENTELRTTEAPLTDAPIAEDVPLDVERSQWKWRLGTVATVRFEGDRARLQTAEGATALTLERQ